MSYLYIYMCVFAYVRVFLSAFSEDEEKVCIDAMRAKQVPNYFLPLLFKFFFLFYSKNSHPSIILSNKTVQVFFLPFFQEAIPQNSSINTFSLLIPPYTHTHICHRHPISLHIPTSSTTIFFSRITYKYA